MKRSCVKNVLILLFCLIVPVLVMFGCTPHGGSSAGTERSASPAQEVKVTGTEITAPPEKTQSAYATPLPAQKATPEASGSSMPSETATVSGTGGPYRTEEAFETVEPANTGKPAETAAPSDNTAAPSDNTAAPSDNTSEPATPSPGTVSNTKNPSTGNSPMPSDVIGPVKTGDKPRETGMIPGPVPEPTPTPGSGIYIDENGNIILPEIPIP